MSSGALYTPYKAVGCVIDSNPFVINRLGDQNFLVASIGKAFQVYRFDRLSVCMVSQPVLRGEIGSFQVAKHETFVSIGSEIHVYDRMRHVRTYKEHESAITGICIVGKTMLSFDDSNFISIINTQERKLVASLQLVQTSQMTVAMHPATYINKFLFGFENGQIELWNINKQNIIYSFKSHLEHIKELEEDLIEDMDVSDDDSECGSGAALKAGKLSAVTFIEQSPSCDVVAIGFSSGIIVLLHLKQDQVLFSFKQEGGAVTSLTFRTDAASDRFPYLASGSADGRVHVWCLGSGGEEDGSDSDSDNEQHTSGPRLRRKLQCSIEDAHRAAVSKVYFMPGEPILVTAAADNTIKVWIFDNPDGSARLLRSREGHEGCPLKIRYYGGTTSVSMRDNAEASSCEIISAGSDGTLRVFNTALESQNKELSQNPILKKYGLLRRNERLPNISHFDFSETRQRDWGNLATVHKDHSNVYLWKYKHRVVMSDVVLRQPHWPQRAFQATINQLSRDTVNERLNHSSSVAMSPCGNYCAVGSKGGAIYLYNVQSGIPRGSFPKSDEDFLMTGAMKAKAALPGNVFYERNNIVGKDSKMVYLEESKNVKKTVVSDTPVCLGHKAAVTGLFVDMTCTSMVSCGMDGKVIFWDFITHAVLNEIDVGAPILFLHGFRDSGLVATAGQDKVLRVYDMSSYKLARRFEGMTREITDVALTPDARRIIASSMDSSVRVWDLPTGRCISWLSFDSPVLSLAVSLSGEFLCVSQMDKEGIYMYIDKSLYETIHLHREPTAGTPVGDCLVQVDGTSEDAQKEGRGDDEDSGSDGAVTKESEFDITILPNQGQAINEDSLESPHQQYAQQAESVAQRGAGAITMSAIPKGYWTSLFNLEAIKARNRPAAPPKAPPVAPFFLPTLVRPGEAAVSFPSPAEFANIMKKQEQEQKEANGEKVKTDTDSSVTMDAEERIAQELAAMGTGAWSDEEEGDDDFFIDKGAVPVKESRIMKRKATLPRCKLVAYILMEFPLGEVADEHLLSNEEVLQQQRNQANDGKILPYLKSIAPPAVDVQFRAICTHETDEEGLKLLQCLVLSLIRNIRMGTNFEVLQAYLHRLLSIYADILLEVDTSLFDKVDLISCLHETHAGATDRFRQLIQSNLCLLKILAKLPPI